MSRSKDPPVAKTILLVRNAFQDDFGGAETYPVSLARILSEMGKNPLLVTRSGKLTDYATKNSVQTINGWWWSRQDWSGWRVTLFPAYIAWQFILTIWYVSIIMRTRADVVHLHSKDDFIAGTFAAKITGKKVVWTDHMDLRYVFRNIAKPLKNPVGKLVYMAAHFADHIILISENEHRLVTSQFKHTDALAERITIIKNGVIDQPCLANSKPRDTFSFRIASRLVSNKGIGEAIAAFKLLQKQLDKQQSVQLDIYGDGADAKHFRSLAKTNPLIHFYGHQENALPAIAGADVFILPSYQEGFSIALLEATMLGKSIIATDVDSNSEIVHDGKTGILVPARDSTALATAMKTLYDNPALRKKIEKNARMSYETSFNLKTIVERQIMPLYDK